MKCPKCSYEWEPRVKEPKSCPRCKQYLPYEKSDNPNTDIEEVFKGL